jgi:hypothetical protein
MERIISFFILAPRLILVCSDHELSQTLIQPKQTGANFNFFLGDENKTGHFLVACFYVKDA